MASEAPSTERDGNRWALLYTTAPTLDPTAAQQAIEGVNWKPDSSAKTRWAPNRLAFFLPAASPPG